MLSKSNSLVKLQRRLAYTFSDETLLSQALTHRSFSSHNNERLEFLGDSILNFAIGESLYNRFSSANEGQLSRLRAKLVRQSTLADLARDFGLGEYLILGIGELKSGGFERDSILSDTVEAIIGAMYLDTDLTFVQNHIVTWFESRLDQLSLDKPLKDAKSRLQEYLQGRQIKLPSYEVVNITGQSHEQIFLVECQCELFDNKVSGQGSSRRIAEQNAASTVLSYLGIEFDSE